MNKKASTYWRIPGVIWAGLAVIIFLFILAGGGAGALIKIGSIMGKIPAWGWLIIIVFFLLFSMGGRRR